ncbi:MAG TPA: FAD-dependent oxidoreductase, partial [bacterium]|nr:FAD-dependent oxidoreductase [bacterium]HPI77994.1 FAD-dependent oxidoreductase [bacterium]
MERTFKAMPAGGTYDVIIVGAGPAGLFAALELVEHNGLKILLIEKGRDLPQRDHRDPSQI